MVKVGQNSLCEGRSSPVLCAPLHGKAGVYAWEKMGGVTMKAAPPGIADMVSDRSLSGAPVEAAEVVQCLSMV